VPFRTRVSQGTAWHDPELTTGLPKVRGGDLELGRRLLAESRGDHELRAVRLAQLSTAAVSHVAMLAWLYGQNPGDADLALWLGGTRIAWAWQVRGSAIADRVSAAQFEEFWLILGGAYDPLVRAAELQPGDPVPWDRLQRHGIGTQRDRAELDEIWDELYRRDPGFYAGHYTRVQVLCEKWQGSDAEALGFAERAASEAPPGSPIAAIPVAAHLEVAVSQSAAPTSYFRQQAVQERLAALADAWCANPDNSPRTAEAHHLFGAAFHLSGDWHRAGRHLSRVSASSIPAVLPWGYLSADPGAAYLQARRDLGLTNGVPVEPGPLPLVPELARAPTPLPAGKNRTRRKGSYAAVAAVVAVLVIRFAILASHSTGSDVSIPEPSAIVSSAGVLRLPGAIGSFTITLNSSTTSLADAFNGLAPLDPGASVRLSGMYWDLTTDSHPFVTVNGVTTTAGATPAQQQALVETALRSSLSGSKPYPAGARGGILECGDVGPGSACVWSDPQSEVALLFTPSRNGATPSMDADAVLTLQIRAAVER
jgi:hypothetical protein